jgi:hypothetical protein
VSVRARALTQTLVFFFAFSPEFSEGPRSNSHFNLNELVTTQLL